MSTATKMATTATESTTNAGKKSGFMITSIVSLELKKLFSVSEISCPRAIKKIWEHIKANNLQVHFILFSFDGSNCFIRLRMARALVFHLYITFMVGR